MKLNPQPEPPGISAFSKFVSKLGKAKLIGFGLGGSGLLVIGGIWLAHISNQNYTFSTDTISITIKPKQMQGPFNVTVPNSSVKKVSFTQSFSGGSGDVAATGKVASGTRSKGTIVVSNGSCRSNTIDGTSVITWVQTGKTYKLDQTSPIIVTNGSYLSIPIIATDSGPDYNAPDGQTWQISGTGGCVSSYGRMPGSTTGGSLTTETVISQADADQAIKIEAQKLFKIHRDAVYSAATTSGVIPISNSETFVVTKTIVKSPVGTQAASFVVGVELDISVQTTTPSDLLAAITVSEPSKDHLKWAPVSASLKSVQSADDSIEISGMGETTPASVNTDAIKQQLTKFNTPCNQIHTTLSANKNIEKFNIIGKPDCLGTPTPKATITVKITDTGY